MAGNYVNIVTNDLHLSKYSQFIHTVSLLRQAQISRDGAQTNQKNMFNHLHILLCQWITTNWDDPELKHYMRAPINVVKHFI